MKNVSLWWVEDGRERMTVDVTGEDGGSLGCDDTDLRDGGGPTSCGGQEQRKVEGLTGKDKE